MWLECLLYITKTLYQIHQTSLPALMPRWACMCLYRSAPKNKQNFFFAHSLPCQRSRDNSFDPHLLTAPILTGALAPTLLPRCPNGPAKARINASFAGDVAVVSV